MPLNAYRQRQQVHIIFFVLLDIVHRLRILGFTFVKSLIGHFEVHVTYYIKSRNVERIFVPMLRNELKRYTGK